MSREISPKMKFDPPSIDQIKCILREKIVGQDIQCLFNELPNNVLKYIIYCYTLFILTQGNRTKKKQNKETSNGY